MNGVIVSILEIVIPFLIGLILENLFSVSQRIIRATYLIINSKAETELTLWIECDNDFNYIKKQIQKLFIKDIEKVKTNNVNLIDIKFKDFDLSIRKHNDGIYIFTIDKTRAGIRDMKNELRNFVHKIETLRKEIKDCKIKNLSVDLYLPYYWKSIKTIKVKGYEIKDYNIEYSNDKLKSHVSIDTKKVNLKNIDIADLISVFDDFTSVF